MAKIQVGVGKEFQVDEASVSNRGDERCRFYGYQETGTESATHGHHSHRGHRHGAGVILGLAASIGVVALLSLAITQPLTAIALLALLVAGTALFGHRLHGRPHFGRHRHHWRRKGEESQRPTQEASQASQTPAQPKEQS